MKQDKLLEDWTLKELHGYCEGTGDCDSCPAKNICGEIPLMWEFGEEADG